VACTIRAFHHVQRQYPAATLTVVGDGPQAGATRALAENLGLTGVQFLGRIEPDRMPQVYADHDVYVQSPDIDNMPLSVLEAFASGLPVVSTDVGGIRTILEHDVHGLLAPPGDDNRLAHLVVRMLEHPDQARAMARAAHATLSAYTWPSVRSAWLETYRRVVGKDVRAAAPVRA
jgi:glycosyltransferase involved in cell wall biosynthesis